MTSPLVNAIAEALRPLWHAAQSSFDLSIGTIYHLAATWDGTDLKLYIDGTLDATDPALSDATLAAAAACIAIVAALPADYTAADVLAVLRGEDVPGEPLPVKDGAA